MLPQSGKLTICTLRSDRRQGDLQNALSQDIPGYIGRV
jgi:hypothetical protein